MNSKERAVMVRQIAERMVEALAERDERKAKLATDQFVLLCEQAASAEAQPDAELVLDADSETASWDQLVAVARFLDGAANACDLSAWIDSAVDELLQFGQTKQQTPEVIARLVEVGKVRSRMRAFIAHARGFVKDIENLYGCRLKDIRRYRCEGGGA